MTEDYVYFLVTYENGRDLRRYLPTADAEEREHPNLPWVKGMTWQRWYIEPGWYKITIEPCFPPGVEPPDD